MTKFRRERESIWFCKKREQLKLARTQSSCVDGDEASLALFRKCSEGAFLVPRSLSRNEKTEAPLLSALSLSQVTEA